jgi:type II secretory pathway component PulF
LAEIILSLLTHVVVVIVAFGILLIFTTILLPSFKNISIASASSASKELLQKCVRGLFRSANAAQECDNIVFLCVDGPFEGGIVTVTAGLRVRGEQHRERAQQAVLHITCFSQLRRLSPK